MLHAQGPEFDPWHHKNKQHWAWEMLLVKGERGGRKESSLEPPNLSRSRQTAQNGSWWIPGVMDWGVSAVLYWTKKSSQGSEAAGQGQHLQTRKHRSRGSPGRGALEMAPPCSPRLRAAR